MIARWGELLQAGYIFPIRDVEARPSERSKLLPVVALWPF
jgi:hypothetical protein